MIDRVPFPSARGTTPTNSTALLHDQGAESGFLKPAGGCQTGDSRSDHNRVGKGTHN